MATKKTSTNALARELAALAKLGKVALQKRFKEVFGRATKSQNSQHLRAAIAKRLHEQSGTAASPARITKTNTSATPTRDRDPRLPAVGSVIERKHHETNHRVKVLDDGFEYRGAKYRSLSGIAKAITGNEWNGFVFFGLTASSKPRAKQTPAAGAEA
jgi:hypothetical protein